MPVRLSCSAVKRTFHGIMYQARWLMLFPKHAVDREYSFRLFTEKKSAKDFDDIVLRYEQDGKIVHRFIQVKHRKGRHKKISIGNLLTPGKSGAFGLIKYLIAYLKIKSSGEFEGEIEDFVIITNDDFDSADSTSDPVRKLRMMPSGKNKRKEISVIRIDTQDEFLDVGDGVRYKFDNSIISYLQENKDFVKREVGREVSDKEIEDFLNKLVFAVNLPSGTELSEIIKSELGKEFSNTDASHFYSRYQEKVLILLEKEEEEFLSYEKAKALLEEIREEVLKTPICYNVIDPIGNFIGRGNELNAVHCGLQKSARQIIVIRGPSGVGKTEFVKKYAHDHKECYGGNVIFINARDYKSVKESFLNLAKDKRLGISATDERGSTKAIKNIVEEIYTFFAGRRSLFIFDNARGYKDISKFLPPFLYSQHPNWRKPYILITSCREKWKVSKAAGKIEEIWLDKFEEIEALQFVERALNVESDFCGGEEKRLIEESFPLALGLAVAYIQNENEDSESKKLNNYLEEYQQQRRKSFEEARELFARERSYKSDTNHIREALATWNMTRNKIESNRRYGKQSTDVWDIMAYFAPDKICIEEIFSKLVADDKKKLWGAVELLDKYKMVNLEAGIANIHELVQEITRLKLQKAGKEEEILRRALELINSGRVVKSTSHVTSVWGYASNHGRLIDDFYFNSSYIHREPFFIKKSTPLHLLAESDDYKAIKAILTHIERHYPGKLREIVNVENDYGQTPLHVAAENGKLNVVECLVSKGANINAEKNDWLPLHVAAYSGELGIVKYLLDKGAGINTKNKHGGTALHRAAYNGKLNVVKYLVNKGADINANAVEPFLNGTPLHFAIYSKKSDIVKYLVSKDADINAKDKNGRPMLHIAVESGKLEVVKCLISKGADINVKSKCNNTPLHVAAYKGKLDMVKYLISRGGDINAKDKYDSTPLHSAAENNIVDIIEYLVEKGADVNAKNKKVFFSDTPLHVAALRGSFGIVKYLINKGADVDAKNRDNETPLHYAARSGNLKVVGYLVRKDTCFNAITEIGDTLLHFAVKSGKLEVVKYFVEKGINVNVKNKCNETPLHYAARNGNLEITEYLIEKGANVNAKNKSGFTPLHWAVIRWRIDVAKVLLKHNADVNAKNNEGKTALHYAAKYNHQELVELLLAHGASCDY